MSGGSGESHGISAMGRRSRRQVGATVTAAACLLMAWLSDATVAAAFQPLPPSCRPVKRRQPRWGIRAPEATSLPLTSERTLVRRSLPSDAALVDTSEDSSASDDDTIGSSKSLTVVERVYDAFNRRSFAEAASYFVADGTLEYDNGSYLGTASTRRQLVRLLENSAAALPEGSTVVVDDLAVDPTNGNIGARWHCERADGTTVPLTRGCSFYTTNTKTGLIRTGFKVTEMVVKPDPRLVEGVVRSASRLLGSSSAAMIGRQPPDAEPLTTATAAEGSIVERYFEAWNRRDMESALACVADDCFYETEDPLFVTALRGRDELRAHLLQNAASLPSSARIVLDDVAVDPINGKTGARWHLEVGGVAVPNLRGCSMYTTDLETGLLKSGWDVTEAPIKIPGPAMGILALPSKLGLLGR